MRASPYVPRTSTSQAAMLRVIAQSTWAVCEATPPQMEKYLAELRSELGRVCELDPAVLQALDAEAATDVLVDRSVLINRIEALYERLADAYRQLSGKERHINDCQTSNAPAFRPRPCDCNAPRDTGSILPVRRWSSSADGAH